MSLESFRMHGRRAGACALSVSVALALVASVTPAMGAASSTISRVSITFGEAQANDQSEYPAISADGRYVAFQSDATNLVPQADGNGDTDIFVRDTTDGTTERVSVTSAEAQVDGDSYEPDISSDGRYVVFYSYAEDLVGGDDNLTNDVFLRDRQAGTTERVSIADDESQADNYSDTASVSDDGRYVAFVSRATNLLGGGGSDEYFVYVRDRTAGTTTMVSLDSSDGEPESACYWSDISADGRYVAYYSAATDIVSGDGDFDDIFVHDRQTGETALASVSTTGGPTHGFSDKPSISADGRYVAFASSAPDLVPGDTNGRRDIFVRDMLTGTTERVSTASDGTQSLHDCDSPSISPDGRYVVFDSQSDLLASGADNGLDGDVFVHDRLKGTTKLVSHESDSTSGNDNSSNACVTTIGNKRFVAFGSDATTLVTSDSNGSEDVFLETATVKTVQTSISGDDRFETAVLASRRAFPAGSGYAIIATARNWPDALGGSALAGAYDAPILLVDTDSVPKVVRNELVRLGNPRCIILGSKKTITQNVFDYLKDTMGLGVRRIGGGDRYQTARLIAQDTIARMGSEYDGVAFYSTGVNFPDALAAAPLAAANGWPIYLSDPTMNADCCALYQDGVTDVHILGGGDSVPLAHDAQLEVHIPNVDRLAGSDRYSTAVAVAAFGVRSAGLHWDGVAITTGLNFPDALSGGVFAARRGAVMMLVQPDALPSPVSKKLAANKDYIGEVTYLGGTGSVSQRVRDAIAARLH